MSRILDFSDGFTSSSTPTTVGGAASSLGVYANDAAYVTAKGAVAAQGDVYSNSTTDTIRQYNGSAWLNVINGTTTDVTATTVPYIDASKQLTSSAITPTQLGYLSPATGNTGTGNLVFATSPTLTTPAIGAATGTTLALTTSINGGLSVTDGTTTGVVYASSSATNSLAVGTTSNHPLVFLTNNTDRVKIDTSGNVRVGYTGVAAVAPLSVYSNTDAQTASVYNYHNNSQTATVMQIASDGGFAAGTQTSTLLDLYKNTTTSAAGKMLTVRPSALGYDAFTILDTGNIGVGVTPSANSKFQINAASAVNFNFRTGVVNTGFMSMNAINDTEAANVGMELRATQFAFTGPTTTNVITTAGNIGVGTTAPASALNVVRDGSACNLMVESYNDINQFIGRRAGGTFASPSSPGTNSLAVFGGRAYVTSGATGFDTSNYGAMEIASTQTHTSTAKGTQIYFNTTADSTTTITQRLTIQADGNIAVNTGNIIMSTSGKGIDFSATANSSGTMTSEILSDYEEGSSASPALTSSSGTITTSAVTVYYTKVGRVVHITFRGSITTNGTGAGTLLISGLPFSPTYDSCGVFTEVQTTGNMGSVRITAASTSMILYSYNGTYPGGSAYTFNGQATYTI